jgi:hypothetical protein
MTETESIMKGQLSLALFVVPLSIFMKQAETADLMDIYPKPFNNSTIIHQVGARNTNDINIHCEILL